MKIKNLIIYITSFFLASNAISYKLCKRNCDQTNASLSSYLEHFEEKDFQVAAHRGFSSLEVENTLGSVSLAANKDYIDYIEMDIRLTKDNQLVLSHDAQTFSHIKP